MTLLTQMGEEYIVDLITGVLTSSTHWLGWGTGAGTADKPDQDVFTPAPEARVPATRTQPFVNRLRWTGTMFADAPRTITNVGVFSSSLVLFPPVPLIMHADHQPIALAGGDGINYQVELEITGADENFVVMGDMVIPGG